MDDEDEEAAPFPSSTDSERQHACDGLTSLTTWSRVLLIAGSSEESDMCVTFWTAPVHERRRTCVLISTRSPS
jgi:hypothetical protein